MANRAPSKKRNNSIKQFVFSTPNKETETPPPEPFNPSAYMKPRPRSKSQDHAFLNRYGKSAHVESTHADRVCFIHNHKVVRASKVYVNIYHLWYKWLNGALRMVGLGGGYHTAIEIDGKEYHFGGCNQIDSGIFETRPLHQMKRIRRYAYPCYRESDWAALEMLSQMGPLKERHVVGLWSGNEADVEVLMRLLKEEGEWKGTNYKLLSFNCNHFVRDVCEILLRHSKHFHPAKGISSSETMVSKSIPSFENARNRSLPICSNLPMS